jgi:hypothetical protein
MEEYKMDNPMFENYGNSDPVEQPIVNPLLAEESGQSEIVAEPVQEPTQAELLLGKFKSVDDLQNAYKNLESFATQTRQELAQFKQLNNQQQQPVQQPEPEVDMSQRNEKFLEEFYDNPLKAVSEIAKSMVEPIQQRIQAEELQKQWVEKARNFSQQHPDLFEHKDDIVQFFQENPEMQMKSNALDVAYAAVKGMKAQAPTDPMAYLNDPDFLSKVTQNEQVRNAVLQNHMQNIKSKPAPNLISTQPGGQQIATPENSPTTLKESTSQFIKYMTMRR